jgi:hypothetical protein
MAPISRCRCPSRRRRRRTQRGVRGSPPRALRCRGRCPGGRSMRAATARRSR